MSQDMNAAILEACIGALIGALIGLLIAFRHRLWPTANPKRHTSQPPANPAVQSFFDANAYVSEHVTAASEQLIESVGHCDGDCIVIMVVNDSLVYRSNIPRERGIEILEIASSAMRQAIED